MKTKRIFVHHLYAITVRLVLLMLLFITIKNAFADTANKTGFNKIDSMIRNNDFNDFNDLSNVDLLLSAHTELVNYKADGANSLLFEAVQHGKAEISKILLSHGADPNSEKLFRAHTSPWRMGLK